MFLKSIFLTHYKNYSFRQFYFSKKIVGIVGNNGVGKTNLLDAIYYLCFTKSYFSSDNICVRNGEQGFRIEGQFTFNNETSNITAILRETGKKEFSLNEEIYGRISKHIGKFPCVIIAPDDVELITGGSERRRKFLDALLSQLQSEYLQRLIDYNKLLQHRNSLLKQFADQQQPDLSLLSVIDDQLAVLGQNIFNTRNTFLKNFLPEVSQHYKSISHNNESVELKYSSMLLDCSMSELLSTHLQKDKLLQRTTVGIHKDDIELLMNGELLRQIGSQGQRKSLLFALKLSEFETLQQQKGIAPILLLDDVFEKLDAVRMNSLLKEVCVEKQGQVFITDTHKDRLESNLFAVGDDFEIIEL